MRAMSLAALIMAASNVLSQALGLLRDLVLAKLAGTSFYADAYTYAFLLPELVNHFLAGSVLSITFIPMFQRYIAEGEEEEGWRFFSNVMTLGTITFIVFIILSMLFTPSAVARLSGPVINNPESPRVFGITVRLTRIILPAQLFFFWGGMLTGAQYAGKRFLLPALTPLIYNLGIIMGGLLLYDRLKIEGFAWGVLAGSFVGCVVVQIPGALRVGMRFRPYINLSDKSLHQYVLATIPLVLGVSMAFSNDIFFRLFGSYAPEGEGALSSLNYASKIMLTLTRVFGQAVAAGTYPFISQLIVEGQIKRAGDIINDLLSKIGGIVIPSAMVMGVLANEVVTVLLQRGAFSAESTEMTAGVLRYYLIGAFFFAGSLVSNRLYYSRRNTVFPMLISSGAVIVTLPLYIVLVPRMGIEGIGLSSSISMILQFFVVYGVWSIRNNNENARGVAGRLAGTIIVSVAGAAVALGLRHYFYTVYGPELSVTLRNFLIGISTGVPSLLFVWATLEMAGILSMRKTLAAVLRRRMR